MKDENQKKNTLSLFMLLAPFIICVTVFVDLMMNINQYKSLIDKGGSVWTYFAVTLITAVIGFVSLGFLLYVVVATKEKVKHIKTAITISHLCFLLEVYYIIHYCVMAGKNAKPVAIAALVFGIVAIVGYLLAFVLPKGPNFIVYFISSLLYLIFMILMVVLLTTRNNGMHIILLIFYSVAIGLASYGIYYFYYRKK